MPRVENCRWFRSAKQSSSPRNLARKRLQRRPIPQLDVRCRSSLQTEGCPMKSIKLVGLVACIVLSITIAIAGQGGAIPAPPPGGGAPQGRGGQGPGAQAPAPNLSFDRILKSNSEPQNWMVYSGSYMSQRYSLLNQITPENARELELKWVFQAKSLEKHEVTPIVVDGTIYTV